MSFKYFMLADVIEHLRNEVETSGSQKSVAEAAGVSQQYLTDVLKLRRAPSGALLSWLGYNRVVLYAKSRKIANG